VSDFRYGLVNRPASWCSLPSPLVWRVEARPDPDQPHHATARHGVLVCDRELSPDQLNQYELAFLIDEKDALALARFACDELIEYADELCALADEGACDEVRFMVMEAVSECVGARYFSLADPEGLVAAVMSRLRAYCSAEAVSAGE
jgi:hypothetical protein